MSKPRLTSIEQLPPARLACEEVEIGEFSVLVWELTGREIQKWSKDNATIRGGKVVKLNTDTATARLLQKALKDDQGRQQFSLADIDELMARGAADVARLEKVARRLSGLDDADEDDEESVGEPSGNGLTTKTPSSIGWPSPSATPVMSS